MKKLFFIILFFAFLFLSFSQALSAPAPTLPPCPATGDPEAKGLVPCGVSCSCTISNFFLMLVRIYNFIVYMIATPLAIIALTVGGIMLMISAGNPNLAGMGKKILYAAIIGLFLVWGSWVIINFIMQTLGYVGAWDRL